MGVLMVVRRVPADILAPAVPVAIPVHLNS